jgi:RNA recognition motif-containing protein
MNANNNKERKGDGLLAERNAERIRTAGRKGTKRFVDPTKVFIGNLPFDAKEADLKEFFKTNLGTTFNLKSAKVIYDWKTNKSKGYGFALFTDPMFATSAMEVCNGRQLLGRPLKLSQGQKKQDLNALYIKKKKNKPQTEEEEAIQQGLDDAEDEEEEFMALEEFDHVSDDFLFADDDEDDDDFEFDGTFEEMYPTEYEPLSEDEQNLNRERRREAQKRKKKKKLPHKGFEAPLP